MSTDEMEIVDDKTDEAPENPPAADTSNVTSFDVFKDEETIGMELLHKLVGRHVLVDLEQNEGPLRGVLFTVDPVERSIVLLTDFDKNTGLPKNAALVPADSIRGLLVVTPTAGQSSDVASSEEKLHPISRLSFEKPTEIPIAVGKEEAKAKEANSLSQLFESTKAFLANNFERVLAALNKHGLKVEVQEVVAPFCRLKQPEGMGELAEAFKERSQKQIVVGPLRIVPPYTENDMICSVTAVKKNVRAVLRMEGVFPEKKLEED